MSIGRSAPSSASAGGWTATASPAKLSQPSLLCHLLRNLTSRGGPTLMDITIIGTGNMARGIATRALAGGHSVTLLGTASDKAQALADELSGDASAGAVG